VITNTREVTNSAASDENDRVLLQVMADTGDVSGTFNTVGQTHTGDLTHSGVRLLGGQGLNRQAHAALLRAALQNRRLRLVSFVLATMANQLINRGHGSTSFQILEK
jgi:hypothetical protein